MSKILGRMSETFRREFERTPQHGALRHQLGVFGLWGTVGDDTSSRLVTVRVAPKYQGADRDRLIHVAAPSEVADRPAVELAVRWFELVDDFHRAHLRRAHQGAGRKSGRKQVEGILSRPEAAGDAADDAHDVAVALDHAVRIDRHRARGPDP